LHSSSFQERKLRAGTPRELPTAATHEATGGRKPAATRTADPQPPHDGKGRGKREDGRLTTPTHARTQEPRRRTTAKETSQNGRRGRQAHPTHGPHGERRPAQTPLQAQNDPRDTTAATQTPRPRQGRNEKTHTSRGEQQRKAETRRQQKEERENEQREKKKTQQHPTKRERTDHPPSNGRTAAQQEGEATTPHPPADGKAQSGGPQKKKRICTAPSHLF